MYVWMSHFNSTHNKKVKLNHFIVVWLYTLLKTTKIHNLANAEFEGVKQILTSSFNRDRILWSINHFYNYQ
jgi:hypothetical protein